MVNLYSKTEMIEAINNYLKQKGFVLRDNYDPIFDPARVPVFGRKGDDSNAQEIFVDIITERNIKVKSYIKDRVFRRSIYDDGLTIRNACSAGFFRHFFPDASVYWAIPDYINHDDEFNHFKSKCQKLNIGLLEVSKSNSNSFSVSSLGDTPDSLNNERLKWTLSIIRKNKRENISKMLKRWSQEDISYLVFYPEPEYRAADISIRDEDHSISRELINKMSELKNINYNEILFEFSETYNTKIKSDYNVALDVTDKLWRNYGLKFPKVHHDFEGVLKLNPRYRDHFLHSFQVFLAGAYIIDGLYNQINKNNFSKNTGETIEDAWLIAATYHDYNYMIQNFDDWTKRFFKAALHLKNGDNNPASLHLSESYVKDGYMFKTGLLLDSLGIKLDDTILNFLYDRILNRKNHGLLSSLSLLQYLEGQRDDILKPIVREAASRSIALHDSDIWQHFSGLAKKSSSDDAGSKIIGRKLFKKVNFSKDPLSFLLIFLDSIQEDGREKYGSNYWAQLDNLYVKDGKVHYGFYFDGDDSINAFERKVKELKVVRKFLNSNRIFSISITDRTSNEQTNFTF